MQYTIRVMADGLLHCLYTDARLTAEFIAVLLADRGYHVRIGEGSKTLTEFNEPEE